EDTSVRSAAGGGARGRAGGGGLGAVFGSKRLKGIAVRGRAGVPGADPEAVLALADDLSERARSPDTSTHRKLASLATLPVFNRLSALPTRNFQSGTFEGAERISGEALHR